MKMKRFFCSWFVIFSLLFSSTFSLQAISCESCTSNCCSRENRGRCVGFSIGGALLGGGAVALGLCFGIEGFCFAPKDQSPSPSPQLRFAPSPEQTTAPSPAPSSHEIPPHCQNKDPDETHARTVLTMDGDFSDLYFLKNALEENNLTATLFIDPMSVEEGPFNWTEIKELKKFSNISIGTLGFQHRSLSNLTEEEIEFFLNQSQRAFASRGIRSEHFSFSNENISAQALSLTSRQYRSASVSRKLLRNSSGINPWPYNPVLLDRFPISNLTKIEDIQALLQRNLEQQNLLILHFGELSPKGLTAPILKELLCSNVSIVSLERALERSKENLLTNGEFDESLNGTWALKAPDYIKQDTSNKGRFPEAKNSLSLTGNALEGHVESEKMNVSSRKSYMASFYVDASRFKGDLYFYVNEYSDKCRWISGIFLGEISSHNKTVTTFSMNYTPSSTRVKQTSLSFFTTAKSFGRVIIDDGEFLENPL